MKFRKEDTLDKIHEQPGLSNIIRMPPEDRPHYLSLVIQLPLECGNEIYRNTGEIVDGWKEDTYYRQKANTMHITVAGMGEINKNPRPIDGIINNLENYFKDFSGRVNSSDIRRDTNDEFYLDFEIKFNEPVIGASGINYPLKTSSAHLIDLIRESEHICGVEIKGFSERSVSGIRYLIPDKERSDYYKEIVKGQLIKASHLDFQHFRTMKVNELHLVKLDKVADYFKVIHTFKIA